MKLFLAATLLLATPSAFAAGAPSLTGKWTIHQSIVGNESETTCTFVVTDAKLSGNCKSNDKDIPVTGSVDGKKVTWKYDTDHDGSTITLNYTATLGDSEKFSGDVEVDPYGVTGDFTATPFKDAGK